MTENLMMEIIQMMTDLDPAELRQLKLRAEILIAHYEKYPILSKDPMFDTFLRDRIRHDLKGRITHEPL